MKIGILGGTFDPIHKGHLYIANEAKKRLNLDKIIFIINGNPPHKDSVFASDNQRLDMLKLAIDMQNDFIIDDVELNLKKHSYTFETLEYLKERYKNDELFFIAGADNITEIPNWKNPKRIFELATVIFLVRPNYNIKDKDINLLKELYKAKILILNVDGVDISSTNIRELLAKNEHKKLLEMLPTKVYDYIMEALVYKQ